MKAKKRKIWYILIDIIIFNIVFLIMGLYLFTYPVVVMRTYHSIGKIESHITAERNESKIHICKVKDGIVSMEFERFLYIFWTEINYEVFYYEDQWLEMRHSSTEDRTILYGIVNNGKINSIKFYTADRQIYHTKVEEDGLFVIIFDGKYSEIQKIEGIDNNNNTIETQIL